MEAMRFPTILLFCSEWNICCFGLQLPDLVSVCSNLVLKMFNFLLFFFIFSIFLGQSCISIELELVIFSFPLLFGLANLIFETDDSALFQVNCFMELVDHLFMGILGLEHCFWDCYLRHLGLQKLVFFLGQLVWEFLVLRFIKSNSLFHRLELFQLQIEVKYLGVVIKLQSLNFLFRVLLLEIKFLEERLISLFIDVDGVYCWLCDFHVNRFHLVVIDCDCSFQLTL